MNSTSIYILVALHPIITLTNMPNTAMEATELLKEIREMGSGGVVDVTYTLKVRRSTGPAPV